MNTDSRTNAIRNNNDHEQEEEKMIRYTFEEINNPDFSEFFDSDFFEDLILICKGCRGINADRYAEAQEQANDILDSFNDVEDGLEWIEDEPLTYETALENCEIKNSPEKLEKLVKWFKNDPDTEDVDSMAEFLTITTGRTWEAQTVSGYTQGDWCSVVYPVGDFTPTQARACGQLYLGCGKEFFLTYDHDINQQVGGYFVADCEAFTDEEIKKTLCDWEGCSPEETEVKLIDGCNTFTRYEYRTI